jgi:lipoprotein-releasing system permease protein
LPPAFSWSLALRYLLSRWVNLVGMLGIALAVWAMIVVVAVFSGFIGDTREGIRQASPDLLVTELPVGADFAPIREALRKDPDVLAIAPRLSHDAILFPIGGWSLPKSTDPIAAGAASAGNNYVLLLGIDAAAEAKVTPLRDWLTGLENNPDPPSGLAVDTYAVADPDAPFSVPSARIRRATSRLRTGKGNVPLLGAEAGIVLGMHRLRAGDAMVPGQRIDILSARFLKTAASPGEGEFELKKIKINSHLSGAYATEHRFFDLGTCLIDIETLREKLGESPLSDRELVTEIAIRLREGADRAAARKRIDAVIDAFGGGETLDWEQQNATYLGAVDRERTLMKIVLFAVLIVAGFLIFATLHMMVVQKTKDIGILTSLGATSSGIGAVFVLSSLAIGTAGCTLGLTSGFLSAYFLNDICAVFEIRLFPQNLYAIDKVPINLEPLWMVQVAAGALILSLIVAWLPARRAARLDPVKALMHE